jgi:hypothetical protein
MARATDVHLLLSPDPYDSRQIEAEYRAGAVDSPRACAGQTIPVRTALDKLWKDEKHATDMKEIIVAMVSFSIFVAAMFLHIPSTSMYDQGRGMTTTSNGRSSATDQRPIKFINVETVPDIFDWLNETFVPQVFVTEDYNGVVLPEEEWGRIAASNKVLGAVNFQVTYMRPGACEMPDFLASLYSNCYDSSKTTVTELLISFDTNASDAAAVLADKKDSGVWLNASTRELRITIVTLNGQLPGYAVTKLRLEFNEGGYIEPSFWTTSTLLDQFPSAAPIVLDALVVLWFFPWTLLSALLSVVLRYKNIRKEPSSRHLNELLRHAGMTISCWAFPDGWLAIDALRGPIVYAFYVTVFITHSAMTNSVFRGKLSALRDAGRSEDDVKATLSSVAASFEHITNLTVLLRLLATAAVFVLGLRILNTFRDHVGLSILTRTMASAVRSFRTFAVIFAVVFMAFASTGTVLFGSSVHEFSSLASSMKTCVNMLFNNFDIETIARINYSVVFYWSYMTLMTFVLLNIVLAIVVDAYKEEKGKKDKSKCWVFRRVLNHVVRHVLAPVWHVLAGCLCGATSRRCSVVFWGRIRSHVLLEALTDRLGAMPLEWTPATILTVRLLGSMFPDATTRECEATLKHLTTAYINQDCCSGSKEDDLDDRGSMRTTLLTEGSWADANAATPDLSARLALLEQKLDFLVEKFTQKLS